MFAGLECGTQVALLTPSWCPSGVSTWADHQWLEALTGSSEKMLTAQIIPCEGHPVWAVHQASGSVMYCQPRLDCILP